MDRTLMTLLSVVMLFTMCNASAPMGDVPDVQTRFEEWAAIQNEKTVKILPGPTPEPESVLRLKAFILCQADLTFALW